MAIDVTMTKKDGVTLATSGKYCEDNIKVSLSDTDSANLVASNIKDGVGILGVKGTYDNSISGITKGQGPYGANDVFVDGGSTGTISGILIDGFDAPVRILNVQTNSGITLQNVKASYLTIEGTSILTISANANDFGTPIISATNLVASNIKDGVSILGVKGTFTNDGTATASDILSGKAAYVKGSKIEGTIATRTESNVSVSGNSVFVQPGYYAQSVQKTVGTAKGATTYTPSTSNQTIDSGTYLTGIQTIKGDNNLKAANIKNGVSIFGVTGTYTGSGLHEFYAEEDWQGETNYTYFKSEIQWTRYIHFYIEPENLTTFSLFVSINQGTMKEFMIGDTKVQVLIIGGTVIIYDYGVIYGSLFNSSLNSITLRPSSDYERSAPFYVEVEGI